MHVLDGEVDAEDNFEENPEDIFDMLQARHAEDSTESAAKQDAGTGAGSFSGGNTHSAFRGP